MSGPDLEPRSLLRAAEEARLLGQTADAARLYERAIDAAEQAGDVEADVLANEKAAAFYIETGRPVVAAAYLAAATRDGAVVHPVAERLLVQRRRAAEAEALATANERMELAMRGSSVGVWELDYRDKKEGEAPTFHTINFWEPLGWPPPEEYERDSTATKYRPDRFHEGDRQALYVQLAAHIRGEREDLHTEVRMAAPDGTWRWCLFRGRAAYDRDGKLVRILGTSVDITDRLALEEETIAATAVAEAANRAKDDFLANVSHEIRTPMNAILGMTELTLETVLTAEQRHWLGTVKSAADNLLVVIDELLDFSKAEANKLELSLAEIPLRAYLAEVLESLVISARQKGLALVLDVADAVPVAVVGDPTRLRQILVNLVGNAIKFTTEGSVTVRVNVVGDVAEREVALSFAVIDTGPGIAADKHALVFEPFSQADATTTRNFGGTGLGLSIATRLAALMQGEIELLSAPGTGATFTLTARFGRSVDGALAPRVDGPARVVDAATRTTPLRVLVAEDSEFNAELVREILRRRGYDVEVVDNGHDVVRLVEEQAFDVLLLDLHMPGLDGFQVIARIRERERTAGGHLPVVAVTARSRAEDREQCLSAGMDAFLGKPIRSAALVDTIEQVAQSSSRFS